MLIILRTQNILAFDFFRIKIVRSFTRTRWTCVQRSACFLYILAGSRRSFLYSEWI